MGVYRLEQRYRDALLVLLGYEVHLHRARGRGNATSRSTGATGRTDALAAFEVR